MEAARATSSRVPAFHATFMQGVQTEATLDFSRESFEIALKNALRQAPDCIMIGEIRDRETAEMAVQAALTGHLVLSTLHTNDAPSSITRLLDLGIPHFLSDTAHGKIGAYVRTWTAGWPGVHLCASEQEALTAALGGDDVAGCGAGSFMPPSTARPVAAARTRQHKSFGRERI